jgi:hypothetical protein
MAQTVNFTWAQGEDLPVALRYREGPDGSEVVVDLTTGFAVRMDIVVPATKERVYTFNTEAIADVDPITVGAQADSVVEGVLSDGAGGSANIEFAVPRTITLPGGTVYAKMTATPAVKVFGYDIFLRNKTTDKQSKILTGTITIEDSNTLWL